MGFFLSLPQDGFFQYLMDIILVKIKEWYSYTTNIPLKSGKPDVRMRNTVMLGSRDMLMLLKDKRIPKALVGFV